MSYSAHILLFLFLNIYSYPSMKNTSNQELLTAANTIVKKIKRIQQHCKNNNIDIKTALSPKEYKGYKQSLAFMKKYNSEIKADNAIMIKGKEQGSKGANPDIEKEPFVEALVQWKGIIEGVFRTLATDYKGVQLNLTEFGNSLHESNLPVVNNLLTDWKSLLKTLPGDSATAEVVFAKLGESKTLASFTVANEKKLKKVYNEAANKYKQYTNNIEQFYATVFPSKDLFVRAIGKSANSEDPNLPINKEAKKEADKEADKERAKAYEKVLDTWKNEEKSALRFSENADTFYINAAQLAKDDGSSILVIYFPVEERQVLVNSIKKGVTGLGEKEPSLRAVAKVAEDAISAFYTQMLAREDIYENLPLEKVAGMALPVGIANWILGHKVPSVDVEQDDKYMAYEKVFDAWYQEEHDTLSKTNGSEFIRIDPSRLDVGANTFGNATIPNLMIDELAKNIKTALEKKEKDEKILEYNAAAMAANDVLEDFKATYGPTGTIYNYRDLAVVQIKKLKFPTGISSWIKDAKIEGGESKDDIKIKIENELKLVLKNTNNFNLEALIKELKIDMGGLTINNDFNFDNDLSLSYNNLSLILKELVEINKEKKKPTKRPKKTKTSTVSLVVEGFSASYLFNSHYSADLELGIDLKLDAKQTYRFDVSSLGLKNRGGSILTKDELAFGGTDSVSVPKGETKTVSVGFSITYNYNLGETAIQLVEGGYQIVTQGGEVGVQAGTPFVQGWAKLNYEETEVGSSVVKGISRGSHEMTFTDHYVFELEVTNNGDSLEVTSKNISFAEKDFSPVCYEDGEKIELSQSTQTIK